MQAPTHSTSKQFVPSSSISPQHKLTILEWVRVLITLTETGLVIAAVLEFQQFLIQIYAARWQMALLFVLVGLMVALLLGQYQLNRNSIAASAIRWSALPSLIVTLFGIGVVVCILTTTPPLT